MAQLDGAYGELISLLAPPRNAVASRKAIEDFFHAKKFGAESRTYLRKRITNPKVLKPLPLKWSPTAKGFRQIFTTAGDSHPLEIAMAFFDGGYICFGTAVYWHNLTTQIPANYYVAKERATRSRASSSLQIDDYYLQDQFLKPARDSNRFATYEGHRFTLIEREYSDFLGVIDAKKQHGGRTITYRVTDLERTLLDCAVAPHRAGGIQTVLHTYRSVANRLSVRRLIDYYGKLRLKYPFWQRIGLLLDGASPDAATSWREHFGTPKLKFYADHSYKSDWTFDPTWKVAYPRGIFA
jgi:predicted transcriptional regulator of viral defense system